MKNVVFMPNIDLGNGRADAYHYSVKSWKYWCNKNNVELVTFETPYTDITKHRANWQKAIHCWDILDDRGIDADNIFLVDASSIISPKLVH